MNLALVEGQDRCARFGERIAVVVLVDLVMRFVGVGGVDLWQWGYSEVGWVASSIACFEKPEQWVIFHDLLPRVCGVDCVAIARALSKVILEMVDVIRQRVDPFPS